MEKSIQAAFRGLARQISIREEDPKDSIFSYLLRTGASWGHWVQFEFASQLQTELDGLGYLVVA